MLTYIKLFVDSLEALEPLDDAERGRLLTALLQYARTGEARKLTGNERFLFPIFRQQLDRDQAEYDRMCQRQRANGSKGGRPRQKPAGFSETRKSQDKDEEKEEEQDQEQDQDKDDGEDKDGQGGADAPAAVAAAFRARTGGTLSAKGREELESFAAELGAECCLRAFDAAVDAGRPSWAYVRGILRAKREQGVRSLEDWDRLEQQREAGKRSAAGLPGDPQPSGERIQKSSDWLDQFLAEQVPEMAGEGDRPPHTSAEACLVT